MYCISISNMLYATDIFIDFEISLFIDNINDETIGIVTAIFAFTDILNYQ